MNRFIVNLGSKLHPVTIIGLLLGLNLFWVGVLDSFGNYFQLVVGAPLLDLENTRGVLSADAAESLIANYGESARNLYWDFFIMDSIMPPLVFGAFALLWVLLLRNDSRQWATQFLASPLLLVPLGVGFFDWWENLAFLNAIMAMPISDVGQMLQIGLAFVWLKAICLYLTFLLTFTLLLYRAYVALGGRLAVGRRREV